MLPLIQFQTASIQPPAVVSVASQLLAPMAINTDSAVTPLAYTANTAPQAANST